VTDPEVLDAWPNMLDAIQAFASSVEGDDKFAKDWVLAMGIERVNKTMNSPTEIRVVSSPNTVAYTVTGLLGWAIDTYQPGEIEE
jgi:hypothetical protein